MKFEVDIVTGSLDIPPYVTIVPPCLKQHRVIINKLNYNHLYYNRKLN